MGAGVRLDGNKARFLGSSAQDVGIEQAFLREPGALSLWEQLLTIVTERFVYRDSLQKHHNKMAWKTMQEGIQYLREKALFGRDGQQMWWSLGQESGK